VTAAVRLRPGLEEALRRRHTILNSRGQVIHTSPVRLPPMAVQVKVPHWIELDPDGGEFPFAGPVGYWCQDKPGWPARRGEQVHLYLGRYASTGASVFVRVFTRDGVPTGWAMGERAPYSHDHRYELAPVEETRQPDLEDAS
jgi:hypothetical protein